MKLTALQPNLFPSKTYFDLIGQVDKVVFIDDSFYNEKTWVNKVALKKQGKKFIFKIDLGKFPSNSNLCDINLDCNKWRKKFLKVISLNYKNCKNFDKVYPVIKEIINLPTDNISQLAAYSAFRMGQEFFNLKGDFVLASKKYKDVKGSFRNRIIEICKKERAKNFHTFSIYKNTFDSNFFIKNGISISYVKSPVNADCSCIDFLMNDLDFS
tara:strand:+ start:258 stop:893 length:636 start_codon:yes stop_codon:yes gene_type:complete